MIHSRAASAGRRARAVLRADAHEGLARGAGLVLLGYVVRLVIGLPAGALVARALDPHGFGAYAVAAAAIGIGATIADFGFSTSATRQIAADLAVAPDRAFGTAAAYTRLRLLGGLVVFAGALALAGPVSDLLGLPQHDGPWLVRLAGATVFASAANGVVSTIHYSLRRYRSLVAGQICASVATLAGLAALFAVHHLSLTAAVAVGVGGNLVSFGLGFALLPSPWRSALRRAAPWRGEESRRLRGFAGWMGLSGVLSMLTSQLDLLLVSRLLDPPTVGLYGLALGLAFKADIVNQVLHTTLLPTVSGLSGPEAFASYARRSFARSLMLTVLLVLALPLAYPFITAVYGHAFAPARPIFYGLMAIIVFDLLTHSVLLLTFPMNLPRWIAASDAVGAVTLAVAGIALIPVFGVYGAIAAKFVAKLGSALVRGSAISRQFRAMRQASQVSVRAPETASAP